MMTVEPNEIDVQGTATLLLIDNSGKVKILGRGSYGQMKKRRWLLPFMADK